MYLIFFLLTLVSLLFSVRLGVVAVVGTGVAFSGLWIGLVYYMERRQIPYYSRFVLAVGVLFLILLVLAVYMGS
jgi:hypothetical protein